MYDYLAHNIYNDMYNYGFITDDTFFDVSKCVADRLIGKNKPMNYTNRVERFDLNDSNILKKRLFMQCVALYGDEVYDAAYSLFPDYEIIFYAYLSYLNKHGCCSSYNGTDAGPCACCRPEQKHKSLMTNIFIIIAIMLLIAVLIGVIVYFIVKACNNKGEDTVAYTRIQ